MSDLKIILAALVLALAPAAGRADMSIIQAEHAFDRAVADVGIREGFLKYLDKQAVTFAPGAVNAYQTYLASPATSDKLTWYPVYARLAGSGDFGYTTGPWTYTTSKGAKIYGEYVTVWHRTGSGWLAIFDGGISHPATEKPETPLPETATPVDTPRRTDSPGHDKAVLELRQAELAYGTRAQRDGAEAAYRHFAGAQARFLRMNRAPFVDRAEDLQDPTDGPTRVSGPPDEAMVAVSGDLGYTYGKTHLPGEAQNGQAGGVYLHIWQWTATGWRILLDLERPLPRRKPAA